MGCCSAIIKRKLLIHTITSIDLRYVILMKETRPKECILHDSIYIKLRNWQNKSMVTEIRIEDAAEGRVV